MGMKDPLPTFTAFVERIRDAHPNFAYIHVIEDRANEASDTLRKIWGDRPYIAASGFERASAIGTVEKHGGLVAFGRHFIANVSSFFLIISPAGDESDDYTVARSSLALEGRHRIDAV